MLDLHWSDMGIWGSRIAQHKVSDNNSTTFWQDVAAISKNHPAVLIDLDNEPRDVNWNVWRVRAKDAAGNVSALSTNASGRIASGNATAAPGPEILIYPNPVTATLRIQVKDLEQATLVNLNGQNAMTTRSDVMDVTHLPPGIYLLNVNTKNQNRVVRIAKQ